MEEEFINQIDDRHFVFKAGFKTKGNDGQDIVYPISKSAFKYLEIEDNIFSPFAKGMAIIENVHGVFDGVVHIRGDYNDLLVLNIEPVLDPNRPNTDQEKEDFALEYIFSIYKVDDQAKDTYPYINKIIYFRETKHQLMIEKRSLFNSIDALELGPDTKITELSNSERAGKTGLMIKEMLKKDIEEDDDSFEDDFDEGSDISIMHHTSTVKDTVYSNLLKFVKYHISQEDSGDSCLLDYDRITKKYSFRSLKKIFENQESEPEKFVIESIIIGGEDDNTSGKEGMKRTLYLGDLSNVENINVSNNYNDNLFRQFVTTIPVPANGSQKHINMYTDVHNIEQIYNKYIEFYVTPFSHVAIDGNAIAPITINEFKKKLNSIKFITTDMPPNMAESVGRNKILNSMIFLGPVLTANLRGSTHRRSGRFFDVHRDGDYEIGPFERKVSGRWFMTNCKHIFINDRYTTRLEGVRTYYSGLDITIPE